MHDAVHGLVYDKYAITLTPPMLQRIGRLERELESTNASTESTKPTHQKYLNLGGSDTISVSIKACLRIQCAVNDDHNLGRVAHATADLEL